MGMALRTNASPLHDRTTYPTGEEAASNFRMHPLRGGTSAILLISRGWLLAAAGQSCWD
jgi:hypothetical protein